MEEDINDKDDSEESWLEVLWLGGFISNVPRSKAMASADAP